jgi:hypothetical protein
MRRIPKRWLRPQHSGIRIPFRIRRVLEHQNSVYKGEISKGKDKDTREFGEWLSDTVEIVKKEREEEVSAKDVLNYMMGERLVDQEYADKVFKLLEECMFDEKILRRIKQRPANLLSIQLEKAELSIALLVGYLNVFVKFIQSVNEYYRLKNKHEFVIGFRNKIWGRILEVNMNASNGSLIYAKDALMNLLVAMKKDDFKHLPGIIHKNLLRRYTRVIILKFLTLRQWRAASEILDAYLEVQFLRDIKSMPKKVFLEIILAALEDKHSNIAIKYMKIWNSGKYHVIKDTAKIITVPELMRISEYRNGVAWENQVKDIQDWKYSKSASFESKYEQACLAVDFDKSVLENNSDEIQSSG